MNANSRNAHSRSDVHDSTNLFAAWLDADGPGKAPPGPLSDAELTDACEAARQIHDLDGGLRSYASAVASQRTRSWEDIMPTNPAFAAPTRTPAFLPASPPSPAPRNRNRFARSWQLAINAALAAILILGLGVGLWREFGPTSPTGPDGQNGLAASGTPTADTVSSSFPYPNGDECTVTPLTQDEARAFFEAVNVATPPPTVRYEHALVPSAEDSAAIMSTFRMWQACTLSMWPMAYSLPLITPWYMARHSTWFMDGYVDDPEDAKDKRPVSDRTIEYLTKISTADETQRATITAAYSDLFPTPTSSGTPMDGPPTATYVPIPNGATPIASPTTSPTRGRSAFPSIFARDITIIGPDRASALVYSVDERSGEIMPITPRVAEFVKVDGHWLLDDFYEPNRG
ncbi:MAG: hypothetical protein QM589_06995 [Thermomicrobiales bacterium]